MKIRRESQKIQPQILQNVLSPRKLQNVILERCKNAALAFGIELLEQEVFSLCGPKFSHKSDYQFLRGGSDKTSILLSGAKYAIKRPRVRGEEGEVQLETLNQLRD